jgi:hypothetical protein
MSKSHCGSYRTKGDRSLKDESFKQRFEAFAIGAMAISLRKTSPNSARKEAFA